MSTATNYYLKSQPKIVSDFKYLTDKYRDELIKSGDLVPTRKKVTNYAKFKKWLRDGISQ